MNIAFILLSILNIIAELTELTYDLGRVTRKYLVPALISLYVIGEMTWDSLTSQEWTMNFDKKTMALMGA